MTVKELEADEALMGGDAGAGYSGGDLESSEGRDSGTEGDEGERRMDCVAVMVDDNNVGAKRSIEVTPTTEYMHKSLVAASHRDHMPGFRASE